MKHKCENTIYIASWSFIQTTYRIGSFRMKPQREPIETVALGIDSKPENRKNTKIRIIYLQKNPNIS